MEARRRSIWVCVEFPDECGQWQAMAADSSLQSFQEARLHFTINSLKRTKGKGDQEKDEGRFDQQTFKSLKIHPHENKGMDVNNSFIHNHQILETTKITFNGQMDKEIVIHNETFSMIKN